MTTTTISEAPVVTLTNGLRVANFSSPHSFNFADGTLLPACEGDRVRAGQLYKEELESPFPGQAGVTAVIPRFSLTADVQDELVRLQNSDRVDVILVPFPVIQCIREAGILDLLTKCATISVKDRETKEIYIDRFCR